MEQYLNLFEHIPEDEHNHISNKIWEALEVVCDDSPFEWSCERLDSLSEGKE